MWLFLLYHFFLLVVTLCMWNEYAVIKYYYFLLYICGSICIIILFNIISFHFYEIKITNYHIIVIIYFFIILSSFFMRFQLLFWLCIGFLVIKLKMCEELIKVLWGLYTVLLCWIILKFLWVLIFFISSLENRIDDLL